LLVVSDNNQIQCQNNVCPRPDAVHLLLQQVRTEHVVTVQDLHWTVEHPLVERVDADGLANCGICDFLDQGQLEPGKYLGVAQKGGQWQLTPQR
jgi:hypothetical protein